MKNYFFIIYTFALLCIGCTSVPTALPPVPDERLVKWQQMETYALVHFEAETSNSDCEQWVSTFASAGMKGVILAMDASWEKDQRNIIHALSDACRLYGLKLGISLSSSDWNQLQAKDLIDNYGPFFELRLKDVAKLTPEAYLSFYSDKNPDMIISSKEGADCRWIGNYEGNCGETNWSFMSKETESRDYKELKYGNAGQPVDTGRMRSLFASRMALSCG